MHKHNFTLFLSNIKSNKKKNQMQKHILPFYPQTNQHNNTSSRSSSPQTQTHTYTHHLPQGHGARQPLCRRGNQKDHHTDICPCFCSLWCGQAVHSQHSQMVCVCVVSCVHAKCESMSNCVGAFCTRASICALSDLVCCPK